MSDGFEFILHSPLTQEDWNKISDVEFENTMSVTFQIPQGRQVKYIKCEVLDKIKSEISKQSKMHMDGDLYIKTSACMQIIDKYKAESEG